MQPQSGYGYNHLSGTAAGTTVVFARSGTFHGITFGLSKTGTIDVYDSATAAGTAAGNLVLSVDNAINAGNLPSTLAVDAGLKNGLTVLQSGTTDVVILYN